jgi:hypothetical protein
MLHRFLQGSFLLALCLLLTSCLGSDAKTLGAKTTGGKGTGVTDSETFSVTMAYRKDADPDDGRLVVLQGIRDIASAALANNCGTAGTTCSCQFYQSTTDTAPLTPTVPNGLSAGNNSLSCTIPGATDPDLYLYVRLKTTTGSKSTGFIKIVNTLTIEDVIGDLEKSKVRGIYRYGCARTFFEGEGVSATEVNCPNSQRLGLISATYNFYLYNSQTGGNLGDKQSDSAYEDQICLRQFTKLTCSGAPDLRWGLYAEKTGPFQVGITMTANAEGEAEATQIYGYAALPDSASNCPTGLVKVRPWQAQPQSIIQGSINGTNPPSSFVNQANNLNNVIVEESQPAAFPVTRQANVTPCSAVDGSCALATFGGSATVQNVTYSSLTPVVCVIPRDLLSGLF